MIHDSYQLMVVFLGVTLLTLILDQRYTVIRKISPVVMIIFLSAVLSNVGLITKASPLYDALIDFTVPFAVCLILFTVNLRDLRRVGVPLLVAFALAWSQRGRYLERRGRERPVVALLLVAVAGACVGAGAAGWLDAVP